MQNIELYHATIRPLINAAFHGSKVTCFAYGQTGSGKTYTMMGEGETKGLQQLALEDVFDLLRTPRFKDLNLTISFYEIYCGKLFDLLNDRKKLVVRMDGKDKVNIVGVQEKRVGSIHSVMQFIDLGQSVRKTGCTGANDQSSRSHAILSIQLKENKRTFGKISFIDLAGSERGADVMDTDRQTRYTTTPD